MSAFDEWLDDYENTNGCITIGAEQASISAFNAGRAYQREKNQRLRDALGSLSNEFDCMHKQVASRYVAERLQALEIE